MKDSEKENIHKKRNDKLMNRVTRKMKPLLINPAFISHKWRIMVQIVIRYNLK